MFQEGEGTRHEEARCKPTRADVRERGTSISDDTSMRRTTRPPVDWNTKLPDVLAALVNTTRTYPCSVDQRGLPQKEILGRYSLVNITSVVSRCVAIAWLTCISWNDMMLVPSLGQVSVQLIH